MIIEIDIDGMILHWKIKFNFLTAFSLLSGNGMIEFPEFVEVLKERLKEADITEDIIEAFKVFDIDKNGYITGDEISKIMASLGEVKTREEIQDMIRVADTNGDGRISFNGKPCLNGNLFR